MLKIFALLAFIASPITVIDDPWTPPTGSPNPPLPESILSTPSSPMSTELLENLANRLAGCGEAEAAAEILAAAANGSVDFQVFENGDTGTKGITATYGSGEGATVGINAFDATADSAAATLLHEWQHVRNRHGKPNPDGSPNEPSTNDQENDPCKHYGTHLKGYKKLRDFKASAEAQGLPFTKHDANKLKQAKDSVDKEYEDCLIKYLGPEVANDLLPGGGAPPSVPKPGDPTQPGEGC